MALYLGILLFSFLITGIALVPFIDILYHLQFLQLKKTSGKALDQRSTPVGGGVLIIGLVTLLYAILFPMLRYLGVYVTTVYPLKEELNVIFFTFISFGLIGLFDDLIKSFHISNRNYFENRHLIKSSAQITLAFISSIMLFQNLNIDIINIPFLGILKLGWGFVPLSTLIILLFTRGFDVTDSMDGLASGVLLICLLAFWAISVSSLDTTLSIFIALWIGGLIAFLYFNVYPARIWLGNAGSLSFGSTLAVTGLLLGKTVALTVIGGIFLLVLVLHYAQVLSLLGLKKRLLPVSPIHYYLLHVGWPEPKVVMRLWLFAIILALFGLWLTGV